MVKEMTDRADALRKRQQYGEAAALYEDVWQKEASPYVARWLIYCRRKAGDLEGAAVFADAVQDRYPDHSYLKTEYAWVFYDGKVKEARESGDLKRLIANAEETLGLSADELLVARVAQAVVKLAKGQTQPPWEVVAEWAAMINPTRLSDRKRSTGDGKTFMSEREEWFVGLARALMETGRYSEARCVAQDGLKQFPGEIFLLRTSALALFHGGDCEAGAAEMRSLRHLPRFDWYMKAELAEMESRLGREEEAYRLLGEALENRQDDKFKLHYFEVLADLALRLGKPAVAAAHVTLAVAIRAKESWKKPVALEELEERTRAAFEAGGEEWQALPADVRELSRYCRDLRAGEKRSAGNIGAGVGGGGGAGLGSRTGSGPGDRIEKPPRLGGKEKSGATTTGVEREMADGGAGPATAALGGRHAGTIMKIDPERPFTFIKPDRGGESVFVALRDLPPECARAGVRVTFDLEESFDRKKNRASVRAAAVEAA